MKLLRLKEGRGLRLGRRTLVMGIINCTPDSFYAQSRVASVKEALESALTMIKEGADILDLGGESTRPGSEYVDAKTEKERIIPLIIEIRGHSGIPISVDTRKAEVAEAALNAGADMINDISALRDDPELADVIQGRGVPVILMHMKGTPKTMQSDPSYEDPVAEITAELLGFAKNAEAKGIPKESIILDPGIGFGKRTVDNLLLLKNLPSFKKTGYPVLVGLSRKSFLGRVIRRDGCPDLPPEERFAASLAGNAWSVCAGADIVRVHDVRETAQMVRIITAIREAGEYV